MQPGFVILELFSVVAVTREERWHPELMLPPFFQVRSEGKIGGDVREELWRIGTVELRQFAQGR